MAQRHKRATVNATGYRFDSNTRKSNETNLGVEFHYSTHNASTIWQEVGNGSGKEGPHVLSVFPACRKLQKNIYLLEN